jgi:hypothetical protein
MIMIIIINIYIREDVCFLFIKKRKDEFIIIAIDDFMSILSVSITLYLIKKGNRELLG